MCLDMLGCIDFIKCLWPHVKLHLASKGLPQEAMLVMDMSFLWTEGQHLKILSLLPENITTLIQHMKSWGIVTLWRVLFIPLFLPTIVNNDTLFNVYWGLEQYFRADVKERLE